MSPSRFLQVSFIGSLALLFGLTSLGQEQGSAREYEVKAAFLFNFAKFTEWPEAKLPRTNTPFIIGIWGDDPFGKDLDQTIAGKNVAGHPIEAKRFTSLAEARNAHILFIGASEKRRLAQLFTAIAGTHVLTISEIDQFCDAGGMIGLRTVANKVRFEINPKAAEKEGIKFSSKLLRLASNPVSK